MSWGYLLRRLAQLVPTSALILLVGFALIHLAPGDPVLALAGEHGDAEYYAFMRAKFGLDQPLHEQLFTFVANLAHGDLGTSYVQGRPASQIILERLPATLLLTATALTIASILGLGFGIFTATRRRAWQDTTATTVLLATYAAPVFLIGQALILLFALGAGWFPVQGMTSAVTPSNGFSHAVDVAHHLVLPALVLAAPEVAVIGRLTRVGLLQELGSDHVRTARAKGSPPPMVVGKHALRGAVMPVVTVIGNRVAHLASGAVVVEVVFGWPGMGRLLVDALRDQDSPIILGIFLLVSLTVMTANLITDLIYVWLDPRVLFS